ncbi:hypothetical protein BJF77_12050 [Kocuria sp. CNJ-770]|uniref:hypothetical protein n=1 Tax=Kocuria sp. CNJ-770 TaxID=1904964 RepID=UPI00096135B3|nr:hypothetical protein [Kocuria sp. CNJ-770]OLT08691.1 hypothetical protein BJF77_12050 [Kocuria sp. CNJ-770]
MTQPLSHPEPVEPASTQYTDWSGTVAADDADGLIGRDSLYKLLDLEQGRHSIVGFDFGVTEGAGSWHISVLVADTKALGVDKFNDWASYVEKHGHIPVTEYALPWDTSFEEFMKATFKRFNVVLARDSMGQQEYPLAVTARGQLPFGSLPADQ